MGDPSAVPDLLAKIATPFDTFLGDGVYDGEPVSQAVLNRQPKAQVVVPPHNNAVCSDAGNKQRNRHIQTIAEQGRLAWQRKTGYNLRSYVELAMQRHESACVAATKNRVMDQCVCTQPNDKSRHACIRKILISVRNGGLWRIFDLFNNALMTRLFASLNVLKCLIDFTPKSCKP
ncbi:MAG: hypothetical protein PHO08_08750 [Methylococcales bacterium]|nr:hypothetical protein [Methylococcales bacterium]MDD5632147.1 hypothetical protein [Methylococcales bacterium]